MSQWSTQKEPTVRYTNKLIEKTTDTNYKEYLQLTKKNLNKTQIKTILPVLFRTCVNDEVYSPRRQNKYKNAVNVKRNKNKTPKQFLSLFQIQRCIRLTGSLVNSFHDEWVRLETVTICSAYVV